MSEAAVSGCRRKNRQVYEYGEMRRTCFSQPHMIIVLAYRTELLIEENASPWISTYVVCGASQESVTVDCLLSYYIYQNTIKGNFCVFFFVFSSPLISTSSMPPPLLTVFTESSAQLLQREGGVGIVLFIAWGRSIAELLVYARPCVVVVFLLGRTL